MDLDERELIAKTLSTVLATQGPEQIPGSLVDLGWFELDPNDNDTVDGLVFVAQGHLQVPSAALDLVALHSLDEEADPEVAVLHPPMSRVVDGTAGEIEGARVAIDGLLLAGYGRSEFVAAPVEYNGGRAVAFLAADSVEPISISGFAPELQLARVRGLVRPEEVRSTPAHVWHLARCRRAVAYELLGTAEILYDMIVGHALDRMLFGRPLGVRQAAKHMVADLIVSIAGARAVLDNCASSQLTDTLAMVAKATAGKAALLAARMAQQMMGAMGFTSEHPLGLALRRASVLDAFLGSSMMLQDQLGRKVLGDRRIPRLFGLEAIDNDSRLVIATLKESAAIQPIV